MNMKRAIKFLNGLIQRHRGFVTAELREIGKWECILRM
jgi:hypothetical protein